MKRFLSGVFVGASVAVFVLTVHAAAQKNAPKILLENDRVRVREVTFTAGAGDAGMHTHDLPHVGVILTAGSLVFTEPGKKPETVKFDVGSVGYRDANVTHQVTNPGATPMRVIEVELKPATGKVP